jgi:hypothetical protein
MTNPVAANPIAQALLEENLLPPNCGDISLHVPVDGAVFVKFECFIEITDLELISRVFKRAAELAKS